MFHHYASLSEVPGPLLLTHPNIPRPLFGFNPRTIMGQEWWDRRRKLSYLHFRNRCWAWGLQRADVLGYITASPYLRQPLLRPWTY